MLVEMEEVKGLPTACLTVVKAGRFPDVSEIKPELHQFTLGEIGIPTSLIL
jgi:hypothetical protein